MTSLRRAAKRIDFRDLVDVGLKDDEFIAAQPRKGIALAQTTTHSLGNLSKQLVTEGMTQGVIHTLETVEIGYRSKSGGWLPGISVLRREGERILRVSDASFEPGDDFCALWHILDLLPDGAGDWAPKFSYP
jgi:hypothetical protein